MRRFGHWGVTLVLAVPIILVLPVLYSTVIVTVMVGTTLLPNQELAVSVLGRRGSMHTVLFAVATGGVLHGGVTAVILLIQRAVVDLVGTVPFEFHAVFTGFLIGVGGFLGVVSHLLGDVLVGGDGKPPIKPFWPVVNTPVRFAFTRSRNPLANDALFKFMVIATTLVYAFRIGFRPVYFY